MKRRLPMVLVFLFSAIFLVINSFQSFQPSSDLPSIESIKLDYSWQIINSTTWQLHKEAKDDLKHTKQIIASADKIQYQNDSKVSDLTAPFIIQQEVDRVVFITSQTGRSEQENIVSLFGGVVIESVDLSANAVKTLTSESVVYNNLLQTLSSNQRTTVQQPGLTISGDTMKFDIGQEKHHFKGNVVTHYIPIEREID